MDCFYIHARFRERGPAGVGKSKKQKYNTILHDKFHHLLSTKRFLTVNLQFVIIVMLNSVSLTQDAKIRKKERKLLAADEREMLLLSCA